MMSERPWHSFPPDGQGFDEIHITTVPRFKQSGLSGDEWRISALIQMKRKGRVIAERTFRDVETAARFLDWTMTEVGESGECDLSDKHYADLCDQEGCAAQATVKYRVKHRYCRDGHKSDASMGSYEYRQFCDDHKHRGDAGLDDGDHNYEPISHER